MVLSVCACSAPIFLATCATGSHTSLHVRPPAPASNRLIRLVSFGINRGHVRRTSAHKSQGSTCRKCMSCWVTQPPKSEQINNSLKGNPVKWARLKRFSSEQCMKKTSNYVTASWQELLGVVVLSAFPFTAVKALANSSLGETLQVRAKQAREAAQRDARVSQAARDKARNESSWYGEARPKYLGPIPFDYPQYLGGDAPGDYGYDILGLSREPTNFAKYFNFEVLHARWAMLGALGAVVPELLTRYGGLNFSEPVWWRVGYAKLQGDTLDYFGIPGLHVAGGQGVLVIAFCQILLMVGPEYARFCGIEALEPLGIYLPGDINYPGGVLFDPLGLSKDVAALEDLKVKEIKNGRLAMVAWLGFFAQAAVTGKGPVENLLDFVSDPAHQNVLAFASRL